MKFRPWVRLVPAGAAGSEFTGHVKAIKLNLSRDVQRDTDGELQVGRRRHFLWLEFFPRDSSAASRTLRALRDGPGGGIAAFSCRANEKSGDWRGTVKLVDDPFAEDEASLRATFDSIAGDDSDIRPSPHLETASGSRASD